MTLTVLTPVVLGITAIIIMISVVVGRRTGFSRTLIRTARIISSAFIAAFLSILFALILADPMIDALRDSDSFRSFIRSMGAYSDVLSYIMQMIISCILFLPIFLFVDLVATGIIALVLSSKAKRATKEVYPSESSAYHVKKDKMLGGIFGAVAGLFLAITVLSPFTGAIRCLGGIDDVFAALYGEDEELPDEINKLNDYANDFTVVLTDNLGGGALFNITSTVFCFGESTNIRSEIETISNLNIATLEKVMASISLLDGKSTRLLEHFVDQASASPFLRYVLYVNVSSMAKAWLNDTTYMGVTRPDPVDSGAIRRFMDSTLSVLARTDMDNVYNDTVTFIHICEIFSEYSDLLTTGDYVKTVASLISSDLVDEIERELRKNKNMDSVRLAMDDIIIQTIAEQINGPLYSSETEKNVLYTNLSNSLNSTLGMNNTDRTDYISDRVSDTFSDYGLNVENGIPDKIAQTLLNRFGSSEYIYPEEIESYFNFYFN